MLSYLFTHTKPAAVETRSQVEPEANSTKPTNPTVATLPADDAVKKCQCAVYRRMLFGIDKKGSLPKSIYDIPECKNLKPKQ